MKNLITENSIYTNDQEKEAFVANKQNVATAFWVNLLGMFGLFSFSSKKGLMKTYFQEDGMLRITNITDENKDLSLLVKLYHEAGGMTMDTANKLTKLLLLIKQRAITSKNFDEAQFREIVSHIRWESVRPIPILQPFIKAFLEDNAPIQTIGKEMYYLVKTRKKEILPYSGEFYTIAKQYIPQMANVPRLNQFGAATTTAPTANPATQPAPIQVPQPAATSDQDEPPIANAPTQAAAPMAPMISSLPGTPAFATTLSGYANSSAANFVPSFNAANPLANILKKPEPAPVVEPVVEPAVAEPVVEPVSTMDADQEQAENDAQTALDNKMHGILDGIFMLTESKEIAKHLKANRVDASDFKEWFEEMIYSESEKAIAIRKDIFKSEQNLAKWTNVLLPFLVRGQEVTKNGYLTNLVSEFSSDIKSEETKKTWIEWFESLKGTEIVDSLLPMAIGVIVDDATYEIKSAYATDKYRHYTLGYDGRRVSQALAGTKRFARSREPAARIALKEAFNARDGALFGSAFMYLVFMNRGGVGVSTIDLKKELDLERYAYDLVWEEFKFTDDFLEFFGSKFKYGIKISMTSTDSLAVDYMKSSGLTSIFNFVPFKNFDNTAENFFEHFSKDEVLNGDAGYLLKQVDYALSSGVLTGNWNRGVDKEVAKALLKLRVHMTPHFDDPAIMGSSNKRIASTLLEVILLSGAYDHDESIKPLLKYVDSATLNNLIAKRKFDERMYNFLKANGVDVISLLSPVPAITYLAFSDPDFIQLQVSKGMVNENTANLINFENPTPEVISHLLNERNAIKHVPEDVRYKMFNVHNSVQYLNAILRIPLATSKPFIKMMSNYLEIDDTNALLVKRVITDHNFSGIKFTKSILNAINSNSITDADKEYLFLTGVDVFDTLPADQVGAVVKMVETSNGNTTIAKKMLEMIPVDMFDTLYERMIDSANALKDPILVVQLNNIRRRVWNKTTVKPYIEKLQQSEIEIRFDIDATRAIEILKYNDIELIPYDSETKISSLDTSKMEIKDLPAIKDDYSPSKLNALSVAINRFRNGRHGDTALKIIKSFSVNMEENKKGVEEKTAELKAEGTKIRTMNPVFHGTGPVAANMILRNGFRVIKQGGAITTAGRMLGDGIYFSNVLDKAAQYVKTDAGDGFGRRHGVVGFLFEMSSLMGKKGRDYTGRNASRNLVSPEWAVFDANRQLIISKAYQVERVSIDVIKSLETTLNESEIEEMMPIAQRLVEGIEDVKDFREMIFENEVEKMIKPHAITVRLVHEQLTDEMVAKFGEGVYADSDNSFVIYNDSHTFLYEIPLISELGDQDFESLLRGDVQKLIQSID